MERHAGAKTEVVVDLIRDELTTPEMRRSSQHNTAIAGSRKG